MKILVDADFTVYKCTAAAEDEIDFGNDVIVVSSRFTDAYSAVDRELTKIRMQFKLSDELILFFSDSENFRKTIAPSYKGHRNRKKPCGYRRVINKLKDDYSVITMPTLEADDALGVYATQHPGNVIVSPDKDMRQIPGKLYNLEEHTLITYEEGAKWHLVQAAAGDNTDGYSGIPGIGVKRASDLLNKHDSKWEAICQAFRERGLSDDDALINARLAKILQHDNYDYDREEPILWTPVL